MKTIIRKLTGKPVVIAKTVPPKPGKLACIECAACGAGVEVDFDVMFDGPPVFYVHHNCYEAAVDLEAEEA